jgi:MerR family transcriptional regulator, heat shock protein HspR
MDLHGYDEPVYIISVAAELLAMHPQTLRLYEREGLIEPQRTDSNNRLYSDHDLDVVKEIRRLTREEGVNLAGVKIILSMQKEISSLRTQSGELNLKP